MERKAGTAVKPGETELARQLEYIRAIRAENDAFAAENGRKSNLLNYLRYYVDSLLAGGLAEADSLFGKEENNWLTRGRKGLLEEARENYDRIVDSSPPYLREKK